MKLDVIILSNAKTDELKQVTEYCLETLNETRGNTQIKALVIEQNPIIRYDNCEVYHLTDAKFHYNKFMNFGAEITKPGADYIAFCNNDLEFTPLWADVILSEMGKNNIESASPLCRILHKGMVYKDKLISGYNTREHVCGWCLVIKRSLFERLGGFDIDVNFWCSDDAYGEQLKAIGVKHYLITQSVVNHFAEYSYKKLLDRREQYEHTFEQVKIFNKKYNRDLWNLH